MKQRQQQIIRIVAIVLAVLLAGTAVVSAVLTLAYAEEAAPAGNRMTIEMEYLEEEQALRMTQRLVYTNDSGRSLDRVLFYAPANLFRRLNSLPYDAGALNAALPEGYLPGGADLLGVTVDGEPADYGFQGEDEAYLRVACALAPGESGVFEFEAYLLLTRNAAFLGASDDGWRLSGFYFAPASLDERGEFILNPPLSFTDYVDSPRMAVEASISLPENYLLAATGAERREPQEGGMSLWTISARDVRGFALAFGKRYREFARTTAGGVELRCLTNVRGVAEDLLAVAAEAVDVCEAWFGPFPYPQIDFAQADGATGALSHAACLWMDASLLRDASERDHAVRVFVARQYFGQRTGGRPVSDAWLSDSLDEYLAYLLLEEAGGHDAYLAALNERLVDSLQLTIPGGLRVNSDASLFTADEYRTVTLDRGAAVFHELRTAMGRDELITGLRRFYERGLKKDVLTEMDLVSALDEASGGSWEDFLTDWLFNIDEYVNQEIDWLD